VSIQIFGGDPEKMAAAAQIVEGMGADIVDINMGCPVPKIAKHNAGCSLMREPKHAASVVAAMAKAVKIPVTVKMRAGWDDGSRNAPDLAKGVQDAGASAVTIHGRTAQQSYSGSADWDLVSEIARDLSIPVFGSGDCVEPWQIVDRLQSGVSGVLVGRGVLRNPWILSQAMALSSGQSPCPVTDAERGLFLLEYIDLLLGEPISEPVGFRHSLGSGAVAADRVALGRERWVINKLRALCAWYSRGCDHGSQFRIRVNSATSIGQLRDIIQEFFLTSTTSPVGLPG
jgi:tRNA-dihydrouridine synthase B